MAQTATLPQSDDCVHTKNVGFPWAFFLIAFCISWSAWVAATALQHSTSFSRFTLALELLGTFGPTVAAFFLTAQEGGLKAVTRLAKRGLPSRIRLPFLLLIAMVPL